MTLQCNYLRPSACKSNGSSFYRRVHGKVIARDRVVVVLLGSISLFGPLRLGELNSMATIPKKRKSEDVLDTLKPEKQSKIQAFFTPRVPLSATCGADQTTSVAKLSDEQNQVLQMVVEEEKSIFFTGSAGECTVFLR